MNDSGVKAALIGGMLVGAFMAFGIVLVVEFLSKPDNNCQASVYVQLHHFAENL